MFRLRPGARTLGVSTVVAFVGAAACGDAQDTPFYDSPAPLGSASSGALTPAGGAVGSGGVATGGSSRGGSTSAGATNTSGGGANATSGAGGTFTNGGAEGAQGGHAGDVALGGSGNVANTGDAGAEPGGASNDAGAPDGQAGATNQPIVDCSPHGVHALAFDGHCYELGTELVTFADAVSNCQARGAHLVTISSEGRTLAEFLAENAFVWLLAGQTETWLGATDGKGVHAQGDGTYYRWITDEPMTFDNWSSGQPNNARSSCQDNRSCSCDQGACYEHCGFQWDTPGRQMDAVPGWNDRVCDHVLSYVCEWDG